MVSPFVKIETGSQSGKPPNPVEFVHLPISHKTSEFSHLLVLAESILSILESPMSPTSYAYYSISGEWDASQQLRLAHILP
jgi:hypothetical protein